MDIRRIRNVIGKRLRCIPIFYPRKKHDALRWGIIGLGNMAEVFATALDIDKSSKIVAVASRNIDKARSFSARHGRPRAYGSYEQMVYDASLNLDVVYIATPAKYHADHIKMCLDAGKNVICEKPITLSPNELQPLIEIASEKKLFLMEGMWMKCLPTFKKAIEWLDNGKIGELEIIKVDFYKREIINTEASIFNSTEGGGVLNDFGVYAIAFMTSFLDGIPQKMSFEKRMSIKGIDTDWSIIAIKDKVRAFVNLSSDFSSLSKAALIGTKGVIEWNSQFNRTNKIALYDENGNKVEEFEVEYTSEGFEYEIEEVRSVLRSGSKQSKLVSLEGSLLTLKVMGMLKA